MVAFMLAHAAHESRTKREECNKRIWQDLLTKQKAVERGWLKASADGNASKECTFSQSFGQAVTLHGAGMSWSFSLVWSARRRLAFCFSFANCQAVIVV